MTWVHLDAPRNRVFLPDCPGGPLYTAPMKKLCGHRLFVSGLVVLAAACLAAPAAAQWQWRGTDGRVVFSDRPPPPEIPESAILGRPRSEQAPASPAPPAPSASTQAGAPAAAAVDKELEARRQREEEQEKAKLAAEEAKLAAQRAENCERAQSFKRTLDSGVRVARTNQKGEREFLTDEQRAEESARTRKVIESDCR